MPEGDRFDILGRVIESGVPLAHCSEYEQGSKTMVLYYELRTVNDPPRLRFGVAGGGLG